MAQLKMLRLLPEQVAKFWNRLWPTLANTLPPNSIATDNQREKILESFLLGKLLMHQFYDQEEDGSVKVYGFVVTTILTPVDGAGSELFIYSIASYGPVGRTKIAEGFELIKQYARGRGCNVVTAFTNLDSLKRYISTMGGDSSYSLLRLEV